MRIVIATPLYPPDIDEPAQYVKELARRLSGVHEVTVILYGHLPESVAGVKFVCIDKRRPAIVRLSHFFFALLRTTRNADILYVQNGVSVELPVLLWSLVARIPFVIHMSDAVSLERAQHNRFFKYIEMQMRKRARQVVEHTPLPRPEILPFDDKPEKELGAFENSWKEHLAYLEHQFHYV